jgi:hypothetical protein
MMRDPASPYQSARRRDPGLNVIDGIASAELRQEMSSVGRYLHFLRPNAAYVRAEVWPGDLDFVSYSGCRCPLTVVLAVLGAMTIYLVPTV